MNNKNIDDIIAFYKTATTDELVERAHRACDENYGNKVYLRGLVEFSNYCDMDCLYCGIRASNANVYRYRLEKEDIIRVAKEGYAKGLKTFVLQSGEDNYYTTELLASIVEEIKAVTENQAAVTLGCGIRSKNDYRVLKDAGADRYLIRFETSDEKLHKYLRNGMTLKRRLQALEDLRACDYELGSGYMVGLPEETEEIRINNARLAAELQLDMVGIGPFIPHPETPLKSAVGHGIELAVRATALVRLLLPESNIPATTAAGSIDVKGREKILYAGANVLMPNVTPTQFKKHYLLYPGKICLDETGFECMGCLADRVAAIDKELSWDRGNSRSHEAVYE